MKIMKKILATLLAISLLSSLCFNASAATTITENAFIGADATAQTLEYAYEPFVGKDPNGNDYDYGSFDARETNAPLSNGKSEYGMKGVYGWKVKTGAAGVQAQTDVDSHSGKYAMKFTNVESNAESILNLYPAIGGKGGDKYSGDITGLVPYANYQFVFWYKGNKTLKVHYHTVVENQDTEIVSSYTAINEWQQASINIMANASGIIKLWLDFGETVSTGQYVLLDDVAFYRCGVATNGSVNLFGDDGLESTVTGDFTFKSSKSKWMDIKDAAGNYTHFARSQDNADNGTTFTMGVSEDVAHGGKKSLKIVSAASANSYLLKLRPQYVYYKYSDAKRVPAENGDYTLSLWIKGDPNVYGLYVYAGDDTGTEYKISNFKSNLENISANEWRQVSIKDIPVTNGDIYVDIQIILYGTNQGATEITPLYIDDIQLVKQVPVVRGDNYIVNGDFEEGQNEFKFDSNLSQNQVEFVEDSISGEKALKITQNAKTETAGYGGTLASDGTFATDGALADVATGEYIVSIWAKGDGSAYCYVDPVKDNRFQIKNPGDNWKMYVKKITITDTNPANAKISFVADGQVGKTLYFDDWRYETVENAIARIGGLLDDFDAKTATANEIEYLRQWVNKLESDLDEDAVRAFRISIGDVSKNGVFDADDIISIRDYLLGNKEGTDAAFDVNSDTAADIRDLVRAVSIPRV